MKSIQAKISRAEKHLSELFKINSEFRSVECTLSVEEDAENELAYLSFNLPPVPEEVPTIVGDCLNNLRSSLDYLVWQIVDTNQIAKPSKSNSFPICKTKKAYKDQLKAKRLRGVPQKAIDQIELLQPYKNDRNYLLNILNELCNKDKHRNLNYSISVASDVTLLFFKNGRNVFTSVIGNDEIKNGEIFGNIGFKPSLLSGKEIEIRGRAQSFLAFKDKQSEFDEALPVIDTLEDITDIIKYRVMDSLAEFVV